MASRYAAGLGSKNLSVEIKGGGKVKEEATVCVSPDNIEEAKKLFNGNILDNVVQKTADGFLISNVFTTAFQSTAILGLVIGKGPTAATKELLERGLPETPTKLLMLASDTYKQALRNGQKELQSH